MPLTSSVFSWVKVDDETIFLAQLPELLHGSNGIISVKAPGKL